MDLTIPAFTKYEFCPFCNGQGKTGIVKRPCHYCRGKGKIPVSAPDGNWESKR